MATLIDVDDFRQKHVSGWSKAVRSMRPTGIERESDLPLPEYYEIAVKAAVKSGWFSDLDDMAAVDEMKPGEVNKLGKQVWKLYGEFQAAGSDPN